MGPTCRKHNACETDVSPPESVMKSSEGWRVSHSASDSRWPDFLIILFLMHKASDSCMSVLGVLRNKGKYAQRDHDPMESPSECPLPCHSIQQTNSKISLNK